MSDPAPPAPGASERSLGALLVGGVAGVVVFAGMVGGGLLLYQRVYGSSVPALIILLAVFGGLGAYLAWLVGVLIFSSVRRPEDGEPESNP
jgi:hypothetical protein